MTAGYFLAVPDTSGKPSCKISSTKEGRESEFYGRLPLRKFAWKRCIPQKTEVDAPQIVCFGDDFRFFWGNVQVPGSQRVRWLFKLPLLE